MKLAGELLLPEAELRQLVKIKKGEVFSRARLTESTKLVTDRLANDGYAFAQVNAVPEIDREKREVAFTLYVDPGRRVYVRRINISGNSTTKDEVIRREFRQLEGAWFSQAKLNRSKARVDRTGFFSEVTVDNPTVPGSNDQVDINMNVKERPTGSVTFGAGVSSAEKIILSASIAQNNAFGSGNALALTLQTGRINRVLSLSYTNPYWTDDGVSRGFDLYSPPFQSDVAADGQLYHQHRRSGRALRRADIRTRQRELRLRRGERRHSHFPNTAFRIKEFVREYGSTNLAFINTVGWARDGRDSTIAPTRGMLQRVTAEVAVPPGDLRY